MLNNCINFLKRFLAPTCYWWSQSLQWPLFLIQLFERVLLQHVSDDLIHCSDISCSLFSPSFEQCSKFARKILHYWVEMCGSLLEFSSLHTTFIKWKPAFVLLQISHWNCETITTCLGRSSPLEWSWGASLHTLHLFYFCSR